MKTKTQKIVSASLLASLVCVATMIIKVPSPLNGYVNLGDCIVLLSGWLLSPLYGFVSAGLGSALADVFSGYAVYAPATFVIKGLMALVAGKSFMVVSKKYNTIASRIISGLLAEIIMVLGYYVFEGFLYGFVPVLANIPANAIQGVFGLVSGCLLIKAFEKNNIF